MKTLFSVVLFLLIIATKVEAQLPPVFVYSDNPELFAHQLDSVMRTTADKKSVERFNDKFLPFWNAKNMPGGVQRYIVETINKLSARRAKVFPDFTNYFETIFAFNEAKHWGKSYNSWNAAISNMLDNKKISIRSINNLFATTQNLLLQHIVFSTAAIKWNTTSSTFSFHYSEGEPLFVSFGKMQLSCVALNNDSITIFDTSGILNLETNEWLGNEGRITWEAAGFPANQVYTTFGKYSISMTGSELEVDSVWFYNYNYFKEAIRGSVKHKILHASNPDAAIYPQFTSYELRFLLKDIYPDVDYEGGFSQNGAKVLGSGSGEMPATVKIFRNDTCFVEARSKYFSLRKDLILSNESEVKIFLAETFIYHPGLLFKFIGSQRRMELIRNGEGLALCPYFDNFHNVTLDVEVISWKNNEHLMEFRGIVGAAQNQAFFESLSYYREEFFDRLQGMDRIHPLQALYNCSEYFGGLPFTIEEYAQFMKLPSNQLRQEVIKLSFEGFVAYNTETDVVQLRPRLTDYLLFRMGKKDFDVIKFNSMTAPTVSNAILNMYNYDLSLNGVSSIAISDHQNVFFFPQNEKIILKRNRNFVFDGTINAGMLNLFGNGFEFDYKEFKINLTNIDSLRMKVLTGGSDFYGREELRNIESSISGLSGVLQIDEKNNKSGTKKMEQYPILRSSKESFVYYEKPEIQSSAYKREKFYFKLDTFQLDSINQLTRNNFSFKGVLVSNIFPQLNENLVVRPDYSLGFVKTTPLEGFPIYNNRGRFYNDIDLSNRGFLGKGILAYQTSTSKSEEFTFLPEQTTGLAQEFEVKKRSQGVEFPDVYGKYSMIDFKPYQDQLLAKSQENRFEMFKKEGLFDGTLIISSSGATGGGNIDLPNSNLEAQKFSFGDHTIHSDSSDFKMIASDLQNVSFSTTDLITDIDFEKRVGRFTSLFGGSKVNFTDNKYISFIKQFSWNMDKNDIYLGAKGSEGNRFISVQRNQDSLQFLAPLARYDLKNKLIEASEVVSIDVADSRIFTHDGVVRVRENANMDALDSVRIEIKDTTLSHKIYDAKIKILGRQKYVGSGNIDFVNGEGKVIPIYLDLIDVDETRTTVGHATVEQEKVLPLNARFNFKGDMKFYANKKHFYYDGGVQMVHDNEVGPRSFILFKSIVNPNDVRIPLGDEVQSYERENVYKDFFMTKDSIHIYTSFFEPRKKYSDIPMLTAKGSLYYNKSAGSFAITNEAKIDNPDTTGVYFEYASRTGDVRGEGDFTLGIDFDRVTNRASGTVIHKRKENKIFLSALLGVDFYLTQPLVVLMVNDIAKSQAKESKLTPETYTKRLSEWIGREQAKKANAKRLVFDEYKEMPASINYMLNLGNIDMVWNTAKKSFYADANTDVSFIKSFPINKQAKVLAQFTRSRSGNYFEVYLEFDENTWYYFNYRGLMMNVFSSNKEFNTLVQNTKADDRRVKGGIGEKGYSFVIATEARKNAFLKRMKNREQAEVNPEEEEEEVLYDENGKEIKDKKKGKEKDGEVENENIGE